MLTESELAKTCRPPELSNFAAAAIHGVLERSTPKLTPETSGESEMDVTQHIENVLFKNSIPLSGRQYVLDRIENGPSREVSNRRGNALVKYSSKKAGTVKLESRRGEFAGAIMMDLEEDVVTFYPQAKQIEVFIRDTDNVVKSRLLYTPDFVVVRREDIAIREYRDEGTLVDQAFQNPHQFYKDDSHRWHYRAAEEAFAAIGLNYEVLSNQSLPAVLINNARFLEDYCRDDAPPVQQEVRLNLKSLIQSNRSISIRRFLEEHSYTADQVFRAIVEGIFYVDLSKERLDITDDLCLFSDEATYRAHKLLELSKLAPVLPVPGTVLIRPGTSLQYEGRKLTVVLSSERDVMLRDDSTGEILNRPLSVIHDLHRKELITSEGIRSESDFKSIADISTDQLGRALRRLDAVRTGRSDLFSDRTISGFARIVDACQTDLDALLSLVDLQHQRGNRTAKLPEVVEEMATKAMEKYNTPEMLTKKAAYGHYITLCEDHAQEHQIKLTPMSYVTFCKRCDVHESIRDRQGKRVAYQKGRIPQSLDDLYPIHGTRPHDVCYIDHTTAVIATRGPDGVELGKPTLTVAVDGHTRQPRAMILTYDPPSTWLVLLVLRDYVRRHQRLPKMISIDNGKEFHSKTLELFCRIYNIDLRYRPPGMPRGGAMIERLIGATEEEVFSAMQGNTRQMRDPRLVTKSVNPFLRSIWTLTAVYFAVEEYLFEIRPNRDHPALGMPPTAYEKQRLQETGERTHTLVRFDENIMLMTSPRAKRPMHKLCDRRGIWVDGQWYRHPAMDGVKKGTKFEVRIEPWLYNVVYVQIGGKWRAAIGNNPRAYAGKGRREVEIAFREQTKQSVVKANRGSVSPNAMRKKGKLTNPENFDPRIGAQHREMVHLFHGLKMTTALDITQESLLQELTQPRLTPSSAEINCANYVPVECTTDVMNAELLPANAADLFDAFNPKNTSSTNGIYDDIQGYI